MCCNLIASLSIRFRIAVTPFLFLSAFTLSSAADALTVDASTLQYPPYEYLENGVAKGMAVDVIREALRRVDNLKVEFNFYPWKRAVLKVKTGQSDLLFNAGKNEARQQWGIYTESVLILQRYVLFKRRADNIQFQQTYAGFEDNSIAIRRGYLYGAGPFRQALDGGRFGHISETDSTEQSINQLLKRRVDMFVGDLAPVLYSIRQQGLEDQIDIVQYQGKDKVVLVWPTYMLFSKKTVNSQLVERINRALEEMKADGSYQKIIQQYMAQRP